MGGGGEEEGVGVTGFLSRVGLVGPAALLPFVGEKGSGGGGDAGRSYLTLALLLVFLWYELTKYRVSQNFTTKL